MKMSTFAWSDITDWKRRDAWFCLTDLSRMVSRWRARFFFFYKIFEIVYLLLLGDGRFCLTDLSKRGRSTGYGLNETVSNFRANCKIVYGRLAKSYAEVNLNWMCVL